MLLKKNIKINKKGGEMGKRPSLLHFLWNRCIYFLHKKIEMDNLKEECKKENKNYKKRTQYLEKKQPKNKPLNNL